MPPPAISATLLGALLLPVLLALLARERALRGPAEIEARWFCFARRMLTLAQMAPILWLIAAMKAVPQTPGLLTYLPTHGAGGAVLVFVAILAPLGLLPALLSLIANQVALRLGTTEITRAETLRRGTWLVAAAVAPAVFLALGAMSVVRAEWLAAVALFAVAAALALACLARNRKGLGLTPHSVTHGLLRDRLFALAERAGVKLQQLYVLPMRRMRLANAFAVSGQMVMVTDLLLERLDRDEVDAILAHEIAHLKRGDPAKLAMANLAAAVVPMVALSFLGWGWVAVGVCGGLLVATAYSRRIERAADGEALRLGASGGAFISGLARLARLSHVPLRWSRWTGWWLTHPSVADRAQTIGHEAGIEPAEVERLLTAPERAAEHYPVPAHIEHGGRLFSTPFKNRTLVRNFFLVLTLAVLVPAAIFAVARNAGIGPDLRAACTLIALLCGPAACVLVIDFLAVQPMIGLRRALARRLRLGADPESGGWRLAGLSPHAEPRVYEGFSNWELGFVRVSDGALEFAGEEVRFAIPADRVVGVAVVAGAPTWIPTRSVQVDWLDDAGDEHSLRITPMGGAALHMIGPSADRLGAEIEAWRSGRGIAAGGSPAPEPAHSLPPSGAVTSADPRTLARLGNLVPFLVLDGIVALLLCTLFGLPVFPFAGPGLLEIMFVALATQLFLLLPALRHRDAAKPEEAGETNRQRSAA